MSAVLPHMVWPYIKLYTSMMGIRTEDKYLIKSLREIRNMEQSDCLNCFLAKTEVLMDCVVHTVRGSYDPSPRRSVSATANCPVSLIMCWLVYRTNRGRTTLDI